MKQAVLLLVCLVLAGVAAPTADVPVNNYEECVKAGYPTGRAAGQERCWTPRDFRIFVKGLKPTIRQGLYGTIILRTGNCMPRSAQMDKDGKVYIPPNLNPCSLTVVDREVYIFPRYEWRQVYPPTDLAPLKVTRSKNGFYEIELLAGMYSVLVEDRGKKYCARSNANHEACPVTIETGTIWEHQIEINHAAH